MHRYPLAKSGARKSTSGKLLSIYDVEQEIGDRLRLPQYAERFTEEDAPLMAEVLQESQPPVVVAPLLLRQWYAKYHQDSGPLAIHSAVDLELYLGDDIRREYPYYRTWALHGALGRRRRPVLLSRQVAETWIEKYAPRRITYKRSGSTVWGTAGDPLAKRSKVSDVEYLRGAGDIEETIGDRYRTEVCDIGLGERFFLSVFL